MFRVPVLWFLQNYTEFGERSVGLAMMISHIGVGTLSAVVGIYQVTEIKREIAEEQK